MNEKQPLEERLARWRREYANAGDEVVEVTGVRFPFAPIANARRTYELDYEEAGVVVHALRAYPQVTAAVAKTLIDPIKQVEQFAKRAKALLVAGRVQATFQAPAPPEAVASRQGMSHADALGVELAAFVEWLRGEGHRVDLLYSVDVTVARYLADR